MSTFSGRYHKGAMKERREDKRAAAVARDSVSAHLPTGRKQRERERRQRIVLPAPNPLFGQTMDDDVPAVPLAPVEGS